MSDVLAPTETAEPVLPVGSATPSLPGTLAAIGGFAGLGLAAALGASTPALLPTGATSALWVYLGAGVLTTPALLVAHQFLQLDARPDALLRSLADSLRLTG